MQGLSREPPKCCKQKSNLENGMSFSLLQSVSGIEVNIIFQVILQ